MPTFQYRAKKSTGETAYGKIEAQSQEEAIELISQQGLLPVSIEEIKLTVSSKAAKSLQAARVSVKEIFYFSRQLSSLIKAGIPILRALHLIRNQVQNAYFKNILAKIEQAIKDGKNFSDSLADYPKIFNPFYIAMIHAGEESGNLKEMLLSLAEYQKNQYEISSKVRSALAYPVLMATVGAGTVFFILAFVMPRITGLFANAGEELPLPTKILMGISDFLKVGWIGVLLIVGAAIFFVYRWSQTKVGNTALSRFRLSLPFLKNFILKAELARFCRSLELLLKSGIPIIKAIRIATPILNNELIRQEFVNCQKDLESGASLGGSLKSSALIPGMVADLITVGEEAGLLEEVLRDIADSYEQETNETVKTMTTLLEPAMILIVGSVVGFIVIAMLLPIFQIDVLAH